MNLGFEVWDRHVKEFPQPYYALGLKISREILAILARYRLALASTGRIPIEADFSFAARNGSLDIASNEIPRNRIYFSDVNELRAEFLRRLDRLEIELGTGALERQAEILPESGGRFADMELPPSLFAIKAENE